MFSNFADFLITIFLLLFFFIIEKECLSIEDLCDEHLNFYHKTLNFDYRIHGLPLERHLVYRSLQVRLGIVLWRCSAFLAMDNFLVTTRGGYVFR